MQSAPPLLATAPSLLVVEDDAALLEVLGSLFDDEGYTVALAASLEAAREHLETRTFDFILTDLLTYDRSALLSVALAIRAAAAPTPVAVLTGWPLDAETVTSAGFSALLRKPFDIDHLLASVAAGMQLAFTPEQEQQRETVVQYFAALNAQDWDALISLCTEAVVYVLPGETPFSGTITGKTAFRAYAEATFQHFEQATFDDLRIFALPLHLSSRYVGHWQRPDGRELRLTGAVRFAFEGARIRQLGVQLSDERLRTLGWSA
ncbi:MAG TPA: nuclear transport factor 2 family protein [Ktedonobacterales bacterium]|nr:nuclear transport factor 2 family protein [Ktedonobacterales bacterium]